MLRTVGLSFEDQVPVVGSDPNRADIALFVGFVARRPNAALPGPVLDWLVAQGWDRVATQRPKANALERLLNVPVPVDNWQVFDYLFDWDQPVSSDGLSGGATLLGAAVRSYFAQGGRKCYLVRAGEPIPPRAVSRDPANRQVYINTWIDRLVPGYPRLFEGSPVDPTGWRGMAHLFGLPDVSILSLPDLPAVLRGPARDVGVAIQPSLPPQTFLDCSEGEETVFLEEYRSPLAAPRCDSLGLAAWAKAVSLAAGTISLLQREVQLVAAVPIPLAGEAAEADLLKALLDDGQGPLAKQPGVTPDGIASAFVQLAYPWLRSAGSVHLPEGLENPEGVLAGILARNALGRGAFLSAAGLHLGDVYDVYPLLFRAATLTPLPVVDTDRPGQRSLIERVTLFGPTPAGLRLLSDVTTSPLEAYRPASVNRLVAVILRAARRLGEELAFESSGERLWGQVRDGLNHLMLSLLQLGALRGASPAEAYQVRCDRSTMTQNDIDAGRVIAEIQFDAAPPIERITVVLALSEGGQVSLASSAGELPVLPPVAPELSQALEAIGDRPLSNPVVLAGSQCLLSLAFQGIRQTLTLPAGSLTPAELVAAINTGLRGGYARLSGAQVNDPEARLVIGSDSRSSVASITVEANPALGFSTRAQVGAP